jgi:hypothetical protein
MPLRFLKAAYSSAGGKDIWASDIKNYLGEIQMF